MNDLRPSGTYALFQQDVWWRTRDGRWLRIEEMAPSHRDNLIRYLRRTADRWNLSCWFDVMSVPSPEHPSDGVALALEELFRDLERDDWLERTPLMKKLVTYERGRFGRLLTRVHNRVYDVTHRRKS